MAVARTRWERYCEYLYIAHDLGLALDISRVFFPNDLFATLGNAMAKAFDAMHDLESGAVVNRDESRMVGHYWLRAPELSPRSSIRDDIVSARQAVVSFAEQVHRGRLTGAHGPFLDLIHIGIGGSAAGPELLCGALETASDPVRVHFLDNVDPHGVDRVLRHLRGGLGQTLVSVVSKSGVTPTPRHVMLEIKGAYERAGLTFAEHAVATTMPGSSLDLHAAQEGWLARFPLWEWVGGRTSVTSAVGLLPAAVQGADIESFLDGAAAMDKLTRTHAVRRNPAALLAMMWHWLGRGRGEKNMVVLPYSERLLALPRWIQQLVMESVGKKLDRAGRTVHQGLTVYGNKGVTDQHSYVQQLCDGPTDFFVTFVRVHRERDGAPVEVEPGVTLGDHLFGGLEGTRDTLCERDRQSITIEIPDASPRALGALVALYERAVGLYAELIDVNAYHQPAVDKFAAYSVLELQHTVLGQLADLDSPQTAEQLATAIGQPHKVETVYKILHHLALSGDRAVSAEDLTLLDTRFFPSPIVVGGGR